MQASVALKQNNRLAGQDCSLRHKFDNRKEMN